MKPQIKNVLIKQVLSVSGINLLKLAYTQTYSICLKKVNNHLFFSTNQFMSRCSDDNYSLNLSV